MRYTAMLGAFVAAALAAGSLAAEEKACVKSGPQCGQGVAAFHVKDVTGPNQGKELCYRCAYGNRPVVMIFTRKLDPSLASLVKKVNDKVEANQDKQMAAFVVLLGADASSKADELKALAEKEKLSIPLTIAADQPNGPETYKIAPEAEETVLIYNNSKVKDNVALKAGELSSAKIDEILQKTSDILQ